MKGWLFSGFWDKEGIPKKNQCHFEVNLIGKSPGKVLKGVEENVMFCF